MSFPMSMLPTKSQQKKGLIEPAHAWPIHSEGSNRYSRPSLHRFASCVTRLPGSSLGRIREADCHGTACNQFIRNGAHPYRCAPQSAKNSGRARGPQPFQMSIAPGGVYGGKPSFPKKRIAPSRGFRPEVFCPQGKPGESGRGGEILPARPLGRKAHGQAA